MQEVLSSVLRRGAAAVDRAMFRPQGKIDASTAVVVDGRYRLDEVLGEGGFGRVWRGVRLSDARAVAFKELHTAEDTSLAQMELEFFLLSRLKHPHIVDVLDYGEHQGKRFIVMELVEGRDLSERVRRGPLPAEEAAIVVARTLQALQLLHSRLLVHCDVKAENIRLAASGTTKLMDFGLLHQLGTPANQVMGTLTTMSPEMLSGGVIDGRSDLYSIGVVAYQALTGELPFRADSAEVLIAQVTRDRPRPPSYFLDLPPGIDAFVLRLLEKNPRDRFEDADTALRALTGAIPIPVVVESTVHRSSYLYSPDAIGRDRERQLLESARATAASQQRRSVFLGGRGGEGKSRLIDELRLKVKLDKAIWSAGQARPAIPPLQPLVEALGPLAIEWAPKLADHAGTLAGLFPEVAARGIRPVVEADAGEQKARILGAIEALVRAAQAAAPVALVLEDLHVADGLTLEVWNHLVRALEKDRVFMVATFRPEELDRASIAYTTVHEGKSEVIELGPLSAAHIRELLDATLGSWQAPDDFSGRIATSTAGNPLAIIETLRALVELGALVREGGVWQVAKLPEQLPQGAGAAFLQRFAEFPPELREAAQKLAPMGRWVDLEIARSLLALDGDTLFQRVDDLIARQALVREGNQLLFTHDAVRLSIYDGIAEGVRRELHDQVATIMSGNVDVEKHPKPGNVAFHYALGKEPERAIPYYFAAADRLLEQQQQVEAMKVLQQVTVLADGTKGPTRRNALVRANNQLAGAIYVAPPIVIGAVEKLAAIWKEENVDLNSIDLSRPSLRYRVRRFLNRKLPSFEVESTDPSLVGRTLIRHRAWQAAALTMMGQVQPALATVKLLESKVTFLEDARAFSLLLRFPVLLTHLNTGEFDAAIAIAEELQRSLADLDPLSSNELAFAKFWSHYGKAIAEALSGAPLSEDNLLNLDAWMKRWGTLGYKGFAWAAQLARGALTGDPVAVDRYLGQTEALNYRLGFPEPATSRGRAMLPYHYVFRGETARAEAIIRRLEIMARVDQWMAVQAGTMRARAGLEALDVEAAAALIPQAMEVARKTGSSRIVQLTCMSGDVERLRGRKDEGRRLIEEALELATSSNRRNPLDATMALRSLSRVLEGDAAEGAAEQALGIAIASKNPLHAGLAHREIFLARLANGRANAKDAQGAARAAFESISNAHQLERLEKVEHDEGLRARI